jgi:hypothetical protein
MNTNLSTPIPSPRAISGEGWAAIAGAVGSAFLLLKKLVTPKPASKPEPVSRADFYAEMLATRERINATHLAILEKLDANHRELLAALDRQATRVNALESGLARVDERTRMQTRNHAGDAHLPG